MKCTDFRKAAFAASFFCLAFAVPCALAQEEGDGAAAGAETSAEAGEDGAAKTEEGATPAKAFHPLVRCVEIEAGTVEVMIPRSTSWEKAEIDRFYPFGSVFRSDSAGKGGAVRAVFAFGPEATVTLDSPAEFSTGEIEIGAEARVLELRRGTVSLSLPRALKPGLFFVKAPYFACADLAGESKFTYAPDPAGDGDEAVVRVVTGSLAVKGHHYSIARMGAANQVTIRTTKDDLFTSLRCDSGIYEATLDQGMVVQKDFETGEEKTVAKTLQYQLSPQCAVKIFRARTSAAGRMAVSVMTFDAFGDMKNRCAFAEGRANVNSGELVPPPAKEKGEGEAKDKNAGGESGESAGGESGDATGEESKTEEE